MKTLVIAPHPDDEVLGCGGLLLKRRSEGAILGWVVMTRVSTGMGWSNSQIEQKGHEVEAVRERLGITTSNFYSLGYETAGLDKIPLATLVERLSGVFKEFQPEEVLLPHPGDAHSDHRVTFDAASACTKWFRYPSVKRVMTYETLSETDAGLDLSRVFIPTIYVDIGEYLEQKINLMTCYSSEIGEFPFPRSDDALRAQAIVRGAESGFRAAEGFCLVRERQG